GATRSRSRSARRAARTPTPVSFPLRSTRPCATPDYSGLPGWLPMEGENGVQGGLTQIIAQCSRGCDHAAITHDPRRIPMELRKLSLAAALALAIGALGAGCAQDAPTTATADPVAVEQAEQAA